jgi:DNA-binding IclR family transcriptional regulator
MQALAGLGYAVVPPGDRRYSRGPALARLGIRVASSLKTVSAAKPWLYELAAKTGEDVYLALPTGTGISYADRIEGSQSMRLDIRLGVERPLHATSVGKLYLAMLDDSELGATLSHLRFERFTARTLTDETELREQLTDIRRLGYSVSDQEHVDGIVAIAAPIVGAGNVFLGALSLSVPQGRFWPRKRELIGDLVATAARVSMMMGSNDEIAVKA